MPGIIDMPRETVFRDGDDAPKKKRRPKRGEPVEPRAKGQANVPVEREVPAPDLQDDRFDDKLRPEKLSQVIGQKAVVERIQVILDATRKREDTLGHLLLDGPPGLGKTTLATVIPKELGVELQVTSGPSLSAPKDLLPYLSNAAENSVLFIDEIHRLPASVEEYLYPAMEDFRIDITLGDGLNARTVNMGLKPFTVIGATTRAGMLTAPLRDRFVYREHLEFYSEDELVRIVERNAEKLKTTVTPEASSEIARRSQGTPRKANNLLIRLRDFATVGREDGRITDDVLRSALTTLEIDHLGLERQDRRYLEVLIGTFGGGPTGLQAMAHTLSVPADTLEDDVEPYLLRTGLLQRTPRGRMATDAAWAHVDAPKPKADGGLF